MPMKTNQAIAQMQICNYNAYMLNQHKSNTTEILNYKCKSMDAGAPSDAATVWELELLGIWILRPLGWRYHLLTRHPGHMDPGPTCGY